jgi:NTE family protein
MKINFVLVVFFFLLESCISPSEQFTASDSIEEIVEEESIEPVFKRKTKIRVALVLGAGGIRGIAHLGVIEELENAKIPFDFIVGCSAGSIIGSLYSSYGSIIKVKEIIKNMKKADVMDVRVFSAWMGLSDCSQLGAFLRSHIKHDNFQKLKIPLYVVATSLESGEKKIFSKGDLITSICASSAYPSVFKPVEINNKLYIDGGVVDPVPTQIARQLGADVVVAVDITRTNLPKQMPSNLFGVARRSLQIMYRSQSKRSVGDADIVIRPNVDDVGSFEDGHNEKLYQSGRKAAHIAIKQIRKILNERKRVSYNYPKLRSAL